MEKKSAHFFHIAASKEVVIISLKMALVVGTILALINHGPSFIKGTLSQENIFQIALTYIVPYCVSSFSSVKAIQKRNL